MLTIDSATLGWAAFAIVSALVELFVPHFGVIFAAFGATAAALAALFSFAFPVQAAVFVAATAGSVLVLRQRFVRRPARHKLPRSRAEGLIGREGIVTQEIETIVGTGRVNVGGEDWAARAGVPMAAGTRIRVVGHDGIVLEVTPA